MLLAAGSRRFLRRGLGARAASVSGFGAPGHGERLERSLGVLLGPRDADDRAQRRPLAGHPLMRAEQVGELLGVPKSWVWEQSRKGRIPTVRLGRYRRYRREAIERWIEELESEVAGR